MAHLALSWLRAPLYTWTIISQNSRQTQTGRFQCFITFLLFEHQRLNCTNGIFNKCHFLILIHCVTVCCLILCTRNNDQDFLYTELHGPPLDVVTETYFKNVIYKLKDIALLDPLKESLTTSRVNPTICLTLSWNRHTFHFLRPFFQTQSISVIHSVRQYRGWGGPGEKKLWFV